MESTVPNFGAPVACSTISMAQRHTEKTPDWLTTYINGGSKKMIDAVQKCASNAEVKRAFERLSATK